MPLTQNLLRAIASLPVANIRQLLSCPLMWLQPAQKYSDNCTPPAPLPLAGQPTTINHLDGPIQINPSGAIIWKGRWIRQRTETSSPDLLVHYLSRRKPIKKAILLSYASVDEHAFETTILPRIRWLKTSPFADRTALIGVGIARLPAFQKAMASGEFLPLEFIIHREDTRLDCEDLHLPIWPDTSVLPS